VNRLFRNERIKELENNRTPVKFTQVAKIALHIIPHSIVLKSSFYDIDLINRNPKLLPPIKPIGIELSHTFDGIVTYSTDLSGIARSYVHLYKNGIIEAVEGSILKPVASNLEIHSIILEKEVLSAVPFYFGALKKLSVKPPFSLYLSLIGVENYVIKLNQPILGVILTPIKEKNLLLDEIFIENYEEILEIEKLLQPCFDGIWKACGAFKSFNYDEEGNWGYGLNMRE